MDRQYVGIDFHRRRSVIVRLNGAGERLAVTRVANDPFELRAAMADAGDSPAVVIEATYGWYWAATCCKSWARRCISRTRRR